MRTAPSGRDIWVPFAVYFLLDLREGWSRTYEGVIDTHGPLIGRLHATALGAIMMRRG